MSEHPLADSRPDHDRRSLASEAMRLASGGPAVAVDTLTNQILRGNHESPAFALPLTPEDVSWAPSLATDRGAPMRLPARTVEEMTEASGRGAALTTRSVGYIAATAPDEPLWGDRPGPERSQ